MDRLRFILLILGVALIAGIFVWELIKKRAADRRRAQIVEHLAEDERSSLLGGVGQHFDQNIGQDIDQDIDEHRGLDAGRESDLDIGLDTGLDIDKADPFESVARAQGRRSADRESLPGGDNEDDDGLEPSLRDYDIDEEFPGEPGEEITQTPAAPVITVSRSDRGAGADNLGPLSALAAKRDGPEQLDLAGLDMAAPARAADAGVEGRRATSGSRRESDRPGTRGDGGEELHIVMTVMARGGEKFSGDRLRHALEHADLCHGEMNIFHRYEQPGDQRTPTLFSAANVLAPGYFEPERMDSISSPGIAMFMRLPGPESPADAFQQMLDAAKTVARDLNGTLCDETRSTLTPQSINHLRERIADFGRRQMLKA